jgi:hypothetical protein
MTESDDDYFEDFDDTETAFDYIETVLETTAPIDRSMGDNLLINHLARHDVPLLQTLLKKHVVFPRDSLMRMLGDSMDSISYDCEAARLLVKAGGTPPGAWLLKAMLANDYDSCRFLDDAGARLSVEEIGRFHSDFEHSRRPGGVADFVDRYTAMDDDFLRYVIAKHFHVDIAEFRSIGFDHFHRVFREDGELPDWWVERRKRLEDVFGFPLNQNTYEKACKCWSDAAGTHDDWMLTLVEASRKDNKYDPYAGCGRLADGRIDAFDVMRKNVKLSTACPRDVHGFERRAKKLADIDEAFFVDRFSVDESENGWRIKDLAVFFMNEHARCGHNALRLEMLDCLLRENGMDVNCFVGQYCFHIPSIEKDVECAFDRDWIPVGGWIEDECAFVPATMLDIAVYEDWWDTIDFLLGRGARVESCLAWTEMYFQVPRTIAWEAKYHFMRPRVKALWDRVRRVVRRLGTICAFARSLYLQCFLPYGPAVKRARVSFDRSACELMRMRKRID